MRFIDHPRPTQRSLYDDVVQGIIDRNKHLPGLKSIVQFGNITTPGISDIDLLFVFNNGQECHSTGFENIPEEHKRLFTHGIMAISDHQYTDNQYYTLWGEHRLVWGDDSSIELKERNQTEESFLKIQTALEFLVANFIDIKIQKEYKVVKLRALLQHMKGVLYDLEYLNDSHSTIHPHLLELKEIIRNWFVVIPSQEKLISWLLSFEKLYDEFVQQVLLKHPLYLPNRDFYSISKNMILKNDSCISFKRNGVLLPNFLSFAGRSFVKLQHRFNQFTITCPITHQAAPIVKERFEFLVSMKDYNRQYLPNFMTITTSITSKII